VLAVVEFLGLVAYEILMAFFMGAFHPMENAKKKRYLFLALFPLVAMTMFHSENIGNDTRAYTDLFEDVKEMTLKMALSNGRFEKGYMLFTYVLTRLFSSRQCVLIAEGAIVYLSLSRWLNKWCKAPGLFVCLIVEMLEIDGWMSAARQSLAVAVLLFAYDALVEKKLLRFFILVILAAQFHAVAYVFLLAWPMLWWVDEYRRNSLEKKWQFEKLMAVCVVGIALLTWPMINLLLKIFPKYQYYMSGVYMDGQARLAIILKIIVYALMLLAPRWIKNQNRGTRQSVVELSLYRMALINIVILVAANQATILTRFSGIFSVYAVAEFSEQASKLKRGKNRKIVTVAALILFALYGVIITIYRTPEWQTTYPFEWWGMK
jgi:hypothetical protein